MNKSSTALAAMMMAATMFDLQQQVLGEFEKQVIAKATSIALDGAATEPVEIKFTITTTLPADLFNELANLGSELTGVEQLESMMDVEI
jgi:hypothetical protein